MIVPTIRTADAGDARALAAFAEATFRVSFVADPQRDVIMAKPVATEPHA